MANTHQRHHYVPAFLLEQWHTAPDARLTALKWAHGGLKADRHTAKHVAWAEHLYSMRRGTAQPDVRPERDFLGPQVDEPASLAHKRLLASGVRGLTPDERVAWSRFLVSLLLRVPRMMVEMRKRGRTVLERGLEESPHEYAALRGDDPEPTLRAWAEAHAPHAFDDLAVRTLPQLIDSEPLNRAFTGPGVGWATRAVPRAAVDLLIGDVPLVLVGAPARTFLLCLPVSPRLAFFAFNDERTWRHIGSESQTGVVKRINASTVGQADTYVYATSSTQAAFVAKRLRRP